jgi:hypothetical protein
VKVVGEEQITGGRAVSWWWGLLTEPAVPFLLVAEGVLVKRDYLPDILLVGAALVVIAVDSLRWGFHEADPSPTSRARASLWLPAAAVALGMALLPRISPVTDAAFAALGLGALWLAWMPGGAPAASHGEVPRTPPTWWLWWVPALVFCTVEVLSLAYQPAPRVDSPAHPSLSGIVEPVLAHWPTRALALLVWLAAGWWLLRRIRRWSA